MFTLVRTHYGTVVEFDPADYNIVGNFCYNLKICFIIKFGILQDGYPPPPPYNCSL